MKYSKRKKRLETRIQDWQKTQSGLRGKDASAYKKPGSLNK
jgi:hypothetical protein